MVPSDLNSEAETKGGKDIAEKKMKSSGVREVPISGILKIIILNIIHLSTNA